MTQRILSHIGHGLRQHQNRNIKGVEGLLIKRGQRLREHDRLKLCILEGTGSDGIQAFRQHQLAAPHTCECARCDHLNAGGQSEIREFLDVFSGRIVHIAVIQILVAPVEDGAVAAVQHIILVSELTAGSKVKGYGRRKYTGIKVLKTRREMQRQGRSGITAVKQTAAKTRKGGHALCKGQICEIIRQGTIFDVGRAGRNRHGSQRRVAECAESEGCQILRQRDFLQGAAIEGIIGDRGYGIRQINACQILAAIEGITGDRGHRIRQHHICQLGASLK